MPQRGKDSGREPSSEAVQAAEEKNLGTLVDTLPAQKRGLVKFKDTGHLVHRFEQGFVDAPAAGAPRAMRHDQIAWVRQGYVRQYVNHFYRQTSFSFAICSMDRAVVQWEGGFYDADTGPGDKGDPRLPAFGRQLAEVVSKARLPAHRTALADGKDLVFGAVVISRQGVRGKDGVVPWSQLDPLTVDHGVTIVRRTGQRRPMISVYPASIPNLPMFVTLYEELRRARPT
jgi:hypothetical protein